LTTPTPPAELTVAADKDTYNVGDAIIVTVTAGDSTQLVEMTITANATDGSGNALSGTTTVSVNQSAPANVNGAAVTDSFGDAYTPQGPVDGVNQVVFAGVVGPVPAA
jgi:hypothetical protein